MAKKVSGFINLTIAGGAANPSPPVGPALGQHGVNIMEFCKAFNAKTEDSKGIPWSSRYTRIAPLISSPKPHLRAISSSKRRKSKKALAPPDATSSRKSAPASSKKSQKRKWKTSMPMTLTQPLKSSPDPQDPWASKWWRTKTWQNQQKTTKQSPKK